MAGATHDETDSALKPPRRPIVTPASDAVAPPPAPMLKASGEAAEAPGAPSTCDTSMRPSMPSSAGTHLPVPVSMQAPASRSQVAVAVGEVGHAVIASQRAQFALPSAWLTWSLSDFASWSMSRDLKTDRLAPVQAPQPPSFAMTMSLGSMQAGRGEAPELPQALAPPTSDTSSASSRSHRVSTASLMFSVSWLSAGAARVVSRSTVHFTGPEKRHSAEFRLTVDTGKRPVCTVAVMRACRTSGDAGEKSRWVM